MYEVLCLFQRVELTYIEDIEIGLDKSYDVGTMTDGEVEVDDAETVGEPIHQREQTGREAMDA